MALCSNKYKIQNLSASKYQFSNKLSTRKRNWARAGLKLCIICHKGAHHYSFVLSMCCSMYTPFCWTYCFIYRCRLSILINSGRTYLHKSAICYPVHLICGASLFTGALLQIVNILRCAEIYAYRLYLKTTHFRLLFWANEVEPKLNLRFYETLCLLRLF